jgi:hypothetical protein
MAGPLVVAEVGKYAGVNVDEIGPVGVVHAGIQDHDAWCIPTAYRTEAALVAGAGNELAGNIVRRAATFYFAFPRFTVWGLTRPARRIATDL